MRFCALLFSFGSCLIPVLSAPSSQVMVRGNDQSHGGSKESSTSVCIDSGVVVGKISQVPDSTVQVRQFLGIPFAQPPVGNLRFAPPLKAQPWSEPLNVMQHSPSCIQDFHTQPGQTAFQETLFNTPPQTPDVESEDCLYLNVYVPTSGCGGNKPVMFWIYGGGFNFGTGSLPIYDGTYLAAKQDIIVVTCNYRTNVFGFPNATQLPLTERNLGYLDQRLALDWVQRNIRAFGGDPTKVTIAGESAGAESVSDLIITLPENPPFRAGILESGQTLTLPSVSALSGSGEAANAWGILMQSINCTQNSSDEILACARAADSTTIQNVQASKALVFNPIVDNVTRLEFPAAAFAMGKVAKVPTLSGSDYNDGSPFVYFAGNNVSEHLLALLPAQTAKVVEQLYAPGSPIVEGLTTGNEIIAKITTDSTFFCPSIIFSNFSTIATHAPSWLYLFNATFTNTQHPEYPNLGVYHSSEIPLVFGTYPQVNATAGERGLSDYMQKSWANFVKDPMKGPGWAAFPSMEIFQASTQEPILTTTPVSSLDEICGAWIKIFASA